MSRLAPVLLLLVAACGDASSDPAPPSPAGCPRLWQGHFQGAGATSSVQVGNGAPEIRLANAVTGEAVYVAQNRYVGGDFTLRVDFADLEHNTTGGTVEVIGKRSCILGTSDN